MVSIADINYKNKHFEHLELTRIHGELTTVQYAGVIPQQARLTTPTSANNLYLANYNYIFSLATPDSRP